MDRLKGLVAASRSSLTKRGPSLSKVLPDGMGDLPERERISVNATDSKSVDEPSGEVNARGSQVRITDDGGGGGSFSTEKHARRSTRHFFGVGKSKSNRPQSQSALDPSTMNYLRILKRELDRRNRLTLADLTLFGTIGKGAFGRVRYVRLRETVFRSGPMKGERVAMALKMMNKVRAAQTMGGVSVASAALKQEITLLKDVEFPFIVNMITFFHDPKRVFIAMEFVNGGELFKLIYSKDAAAALTIDVARQLFSEMVLTIEELHSRRIIYRDLKPENVLLDGAGHSKLVDFGLARQLDETGRTRTNCGTLAYQAPEILLNLEYTYSVDFWALGCVLFELICRKIPWLQVSKASSNSMFVISQAIMALNIQWPWRMDPSAKQLVKKMLLHDPLKRWGGEVFPPSHIKGSLFCSEVDWGSILNLKHKTLYKPQVSEPSENVNATEESMEDDGPDLGSADKNIWAQTLDALAAAAKEDGEKEEKEEKDVADADAEAKKKAKRPVGERLANLTKKKFAPS